MSCWRTAFVTQALTTGPVGSKALDTLRSSVLSVHGFVRTRHSKAGGTAGTAGAAGTGTTSASKSGSVDGREGNAGWVSVEATAGAVIIRGVDDASAVQALDARARELMSAGRHKGPRTGGDGSLDVLIVQGQHSDSPFFQSFFTFIVGCLI